jgi:SAM-dependent methyltransferase
MSSLKYSRGFFKDQQGESASSAQVVVPLIQEYIAAKSVVDVGCGIGTWLVEFQKRGVSDILGIDGEWVSAEQRKIPKEAFQAADLRSPLQVPRRFDLALCVEVAEHLEAQYAFSLVKSLTQLAPVVAFSAAIPYQGGTGHVNEQWPDYWSQLFSKHDYVCFDPLRLAIWQDHRVAWWYSQNLLLFVHREHAGRLVKLTEHLVSEPVRLVHPENFLAHANLRSASIGGILRAVAGIPKRALKRLLNWR